MEDVIKIYADGACRGNQNDNNLGGYGVVLYYKDNIKELNGYEFNTTNNRMEIKACIEGLKLLKHFNKPIEVYSDSQYVVNTINMNWAKNKNQDLWVELLYLINKFNNIRFIKVKGHSDNPGNNRADELANIAMDNYIKGI